MPKHKKTFVTAGKEHFRADPQPRSPSTISLSWSKLQSADSFKNKFIMLDNAQQALDVLRGRVIEQVKERDERLLGRRSGAPTGGSAPRSNDGAGASGAVKKTRIVAKSLPGGSYERPAFTGQRLSPRLHPDIGGSGSKESHAEVLHRDGSPMRQPAI